MQDAWSRTVGCTDGMGRGRDLRVTLDENHNIVILTPPGDAAVMPPTKVEDVKQALTEAQIESIHRRMSW